MLIVPWAVFTFLAARVADVGEPGDSVWLVLARTAFVGVLIGLAAAWLESGPLARWGRRLPLWASLVARTVSYAAVVIVALAVLIAVLSRVDRGVSLLETVRTGRVPGVRLRPCRS